MNIIIHIIIVAALATIVVFEAVRLEREIKALDEAVYQYMKEEHNARVKADE